MGLNKHTPPQSGRMGMLWTLGTVEGALILEYGAMGHMVYGYKWLEKSAVLTRARLCSTHITEQRIALGDASALSDALGEWLAEEKPCEGVFLLPSAIPETTGTDIGYEAEAMAETYAPLRVTALEKGGMKQRLKDGVEEALYQLAKWTESAGKKERTFNIIGSQIDHANYYADVEELKRLVTEGLGVTCRCVMTSEMHLCDLKRAGDVAVNLVIREEGLKAAKWLESKWGTPYVYGRPYGVQGTFQWLKCVGEAMGVSVNTAFIDKEKRASAHLYKRLTYFDASQLKVGISGEVSFVEPLRAFLEGEVGGVVAAVEPGETYDMALCENTFRGRITAKTFLPLTRDTHSETINRYTPPYVGIRGAHFLIDQLVGA